MAGLISEGWISTNVNEHIQCPLHRVALISGDWNRETSVYTEVSSFQGEGSNRGIPLYTKVSEYGKEGIHCIMAKGRIL